MRRAGVVPVPGRRGGGSRGLLALPPRQVAPVVWCLGAGLFGSAVSCATGIRNLGPADGAAADIGMAVAGDVPDSAQAGAEQAGAGVGEDAPPAEGAASADLVVGAVLPVSGSPSNRQYARLFIEGLEVGAMLARQDGVNVEVLIEDNLGTASGSARGVDALLAQGALAIIGPLASDNVRAAVRAAPRDLAFFSPTAEQLPYGRSGVYSLAAGDPEAGRTLAETLWELGYTDAVVLHPRTSQESVEMDAFERAFVSLGGIVLRRIRYVPGTTTFEDYLTQAGALAPAVLVVAAPPTDVELLAPQIAFFGLDEMELQIAGTAGWTAPLVVEGVAQRHTDSVIAVSASPPGVVRQPPPDFVTAYETLFRRSLNSMVPVAGFDLLSMVLNAYRDGARASREVMAALERTGPHEGVTGTYSFTGGRLTRRFHPVRILRGGLHPLHADARLIPASR